MERWIDGPISVHLRRSMLVVGARLVHEVARSLYCMDSAASSAGSPQDTRPHDEGKVLAKPCRAPPHFESRTSVKEGIEAIIHVLAASGVKGGGHAVSGYSSALVVVVVVVVIVQNSHVSFDVRRRDFCGCFRRSNPESQAFRLVPQAARLLAPVGRNGTGSPGSGLPACRSGVSVCDSIVAGNWERNTQIDPR